MVQDGCLRQVKGGTILALRGIGGVHIQRWEGEKDEDSADEEQ